MIHYMLKDLLSSVEIRRLKLIRYFEIENTVENYQEIMKDLNYNYKTLRNDIDYIENNFGQVCHVVFNEDRQLRLNFYSGDINSFILSYYDSIIGVQMLRCLLEEKHSVTSLAQKLNISDSTCYLYLKNLRAFLEKYDLVLGRKKLEITGDEVQVRKIIFLLDYIRRGENRYKLWAGEIIKSIQFLGIKYGPLLKRELSMVIDIVIRRSAMGKNVNITNEVYKKIKEHAVYEELYLPLKKFFDNKIPLPRDELVYLIIFLLNNTDMIMKETDVLVLKEKSPVIYNAVCELAKLFEDNLSIPLMGEKRFFCNLFSFLKSRYINMRFIPSDYYFINLNERKEKPPIKLNYLQKSELKLIKELFYYWAKEYDLKYIEQRDIEECWVLLEGYRMQGRTQVNKYKVLISISKGIAWEYYIESMLKRIFDDKSLCIYHYHELDEQSLQELKVDFVISDYKIDIQPTSGKTYIIESIYDHSLFSQDMFNIS